MCVNKNLISIIVPVYRVENYLPRCIDSLINQTYRNIEIILVDDGSPDKSGDICDDYGIKDSRIRVIHKPNGGLSDARNRGLDLAEGDFVMFVDSDDWLDNKTCETVICMALENKADIVSYGVRDVYDNGKAINYISPFTGVITPFESIKALIYNIRYYGIFNYVCNKLFSIRLFSNLRFPKDRLAEDQGVTYQLFHNAAKICVCNQCFYNYYQRNGSITTSQYSPKLIQDRHSLWLERLNFIKIFYPELVDMQAAQILGVAYVSMIILRKNEEYRDLWLSMSNFAKECQSNEKKLAKFDKRIWLHYYCYPAFWAYVTLVIKSKAK